MLCEKWENPFLYGFLNYLDLRNRSHLRSIRFQRIMEGTAFLVGNNVQFP